MAKFALLPAPNHPDYEYLVHADGCQDILLDQNKYKIDNVIRFGADDKEEIIDFALDDDELDFTPDDVYILNCATQLLKATGSKPTWISVNHEMSQKKLALVLVRVLPSSAEQIDKMSDIAYKELISNELHRVGQGAYRWEGSSDERLKEEISFKLSMRIVSWVYYGSEWSDEDQNLVREYTAKLEQ